MATPLLALLLSIAALAPRPAAAMAVEIFAEAAKPIFELACRGLEIVDTKHLSNFDIDQYGIGIGMVWR